MVRLYEALTKKFSWSFGGLGVGFWRNKYFLTGIRL